MPLALFGITNDGLNLAVNLIVLFLVVVWIALVVWTYMDARRRLSDPVLVASATVASLFPFVGSLVYSIVRPPEFLADKRERELEIRSAELRVRQLEEASCPNCSFPIERTYLRCPSCKVRVKDPCESCGKPIDPRWSLCPYCESPVRRAAPAPPKTAPKRRAKPAAPAPSAERRRKPSEAARRVSESAERPAPSGGERAAASDERQKAPARKAPDRAQRPPKQRQASAPKKRPAPAAEQTQPPTEESAAAKPAPTPAPAEGGEERSGSPAS
jgi:Double zinc ribbon